MWNAIARQVDTRVQVKGDGYVQCIVLAFVRPCACEPAQNVRGNILLLPHTCFRARRTKWCYCKAAWVNKRTRHASWTAHYFLTITPAWIFFFKISVCFSLDEWPKYPTLSHPPYSALEPWLYFSTIYSSTWTWRVVESHRYDLCVDLLPGTIGNRVLALRSHPERSVSWGLMTRHERSPDQRQKWEPGK